MQNTDKSTESAALPPLDPLFLEFLALNGIEVKEYEFRVEKRFLRFAKPPNLMNLNSKRRKTNSSGESDTNSGGLGTSSVVSPLSSVQETIKKFNEELRIQVGAASGSNMDVGVESVVWFPDFYSLDASFSIGNTSLFRDGLVYGMDIASGVACHALQIQPNDQILDLCCAPGAKLCYLFDLLGPDGRGTVTGVDISKKRLFTAKSIIQKYKIDRARLFLADGTSFATPPPSRIGPVSIISNSNDGSPKNQVEFVKPFFANRLIRSDPQNIAGLYDKVLVDAECTHDGSIAHIQKYIKKNWEGFESEFLSARRLSTLHDLQFNLLCNGYKMLKPGGLLVYSTCSFSKKQNEDIVLQFLETHRHIHHESDVGGSNPGKTEDSDDSTLLELCQIPSVVSDIPFPCVPISKKKENISADFPLIRLVWERTLRFSPQFSNTSGLFIALFRKKKMDMHDI